MAGPFVESSGRSRGRVAADLCAVRAVGGRGDRLGQALERTCDDVVDGVFSMSFSAPHLFADRRDAFEAELRRSLREASPSGLFSERGPGTEVFVWWRDPPGA